MSNDPTGYEVRLSFDWDDGTVTEPCVSGQSYRHDYVGMGRYTLPQTITCSHQLFNSGR